MRETAAQALAVALRAMPEDVVSLALQHLQQLCSQVGCICASGYWSVIYLWRMPEDIGSI